MLNIFSIQTIYKCAFIEFYCPTTSIYILQPTLPFTNSAGNICKMPSASLRASSLATSLCQTCVFWWWLPSLQLTDGWKMILSFWDTICSGAMLVSLWWLVLGRETTQSIYYNSNLCRSKSPRFKLTNKNGASVSKYTIKQQTSLLQIAPILVTICHILPTYQHIQDKTRGGSLLACSNEKYSWRKFFMASQPTPP